MARDSQIIQNNKLFAISLQCLTKEVSDEVNFFHADMHEPFLQVNTITLIGMVNHWQSSQNSKLAIPLRYLKKTKLEMKLTFCVQINLKVSWKLISTI